MAVVVAFFGRIQNRRSETFRSGKVLPPPLDLLAPVVLLLAQLLTDPFDDPSRNVPAALGREHLGQSLRGVEDEA
jgi:hypothetical protein